MRKECNCNVEYVHFVSEGLRLAVAAMNLQPLSDCKYLVLRRDSCEQHFARSSAIQSQLGPILSPLVPGSSMGFFTL